jgi:hypothetical protein
LISFGVTYELNEKSNRDPKKPLSGTGMLLLIALLEMSALGGDGGPRPQ